MSANVRDLIDGSMGDAPRGAMRWIPPEVLLRRARWRAASGVRAEYRRRRGGRW